MSAPRILVIDNYDSFTYNLVQYLGRFGAEVEVYRNDKIDVQAIVDKDPDGILLSPGPCTPKESGVCLDILRAALSVPWPRIPIFSVCLGHEAIAEVAGGKVVVAKKIMHGKSSPIEHDGRRLLQGMPNPFQAIRYHSLVIDKELIPVGFYVSATALDDGEIMGIRHENLPIEGVQFHPESVKTEEGERIVKNFVDQVAEIKQKTMAAR